MQKLNCTNESLNFIEIDEDYVIKQLSTLRVDKATGIDGIGARLLRAGAYQIVSPLTYILNLTIRTAVIPLEWKKAVVSSIPRSMNICEEMGCYLLYNLGLGLNTQLLLQ